MNEQIKTGKKRTILISISILLVSLHTIYFYHAVRPEIETKKLIQQIIRFLLTIGLLVLVYKGKKWAKIVSIILFSLAILGALIGLVTIGSESFVNKVPLLVMILIYSVAVYHFGFSKSFNAFFEHQNGIKKELENEE
jgi:fatty acid desaturase